MKLRCLLAHRWEYLTGDRWDDRGQRCTRCGHTIITRHADPRPAHIAAEANRRPTAMDLAARAALARPAICTTSLYAPRTSEGHERITNAKRAAIQASATSARRRFSEPHAAGDRVRQAAARR